MMSVENIYPKDEKSDFAYMMGCVAKLLSSIQSEQEDANGDGRGEKQTTEFHDGL